MKYEEWKQKQDISDAILQGGALAIGVIALVVCFALAFGACAVQKIFVEEEFTGEVRLITESGGVCALIIVAEPVPQMVRRFHLGMWQDYVANVPGGYPLPYEVTRWPTMIPDTCDQLGQCQWLDVREGLDCAWLPRLGRVVEVGAQ